ncbi:MAG: TonB-dependent receptor plug domain-containing protein [Candidatus Eutrophobiaceae bacterium]
MILPLSRFFPFLPHFFKPALSRPTPRRGTEQQWLRPCFFLAALVLLQALSTHAQALDDNVVNPQEELIVTGTRTPQQAWFLPLASTVLDRAFIDRAQPRNLPDLLLNVPGLDVRMSGGPGKLSSIFLRGAESDHVLALIDGVKINSLSSGSVPWEHIPVDAIERVEIVRGPRASLWGADAIGGVINIITRKPTKTRHYGLRTGYGRYGTRNFAAHAQEQLTTDFGYSASFSWTDTHGFDARQPQAISAFYPPADAAADMDNDGYENLAGQWKANYRFAEKGEFGLHGLLADSTVEYDGGYQDESKNQQRVLGSYLNWDWSQWWRSRFQATESRDDAKNYKTSPGKQTNVSLFNTRRLQFLWQNDLLLPSGQEISLGLESLNELLDSSTQYAESNRHNRAAFLQGQWAYESHLWNFSVRHDDNESYGGHTTGSVGWSYAFFDELLWYASYGSAFEAPVQ